MIDRMFIKPSQPVAFTHVAVGFALAAIGFFVATPALRESGGPVWLGLIFSIGGLLEAWVGMRNLLTPKGIPAFEIVSANDEADSSAVKNRLQELDALKEDSLISAEEYTEKRKQILESL